MTKVTLSGECGNSPKNAFAEQAAIAILTGDASRLGDWLTEDCIAVAADGVKAEGREAAVTALTKAVGNPDGLKILHAITHGRIGAVNGTYTRGKATTGFALNFEFRNTKADGIVVIRLYLA